MVTNHSGFTIIELLVVSAIIAILSAAGFVSYQAASQVSHDTKRISDLEQIRAALEMYKSDYGYYPSVGSCTSSCSFHKVNENFLGDLTPDYISALPEDPVNPTTYPYKYKSTDYSSTAGHHYGYCLTANLNKNQTDTCTPEDGYNYGVKSP